MNFSFPKGLELSGANSTTKYILWSMIIFLVILVGTLSIAAIKQLMKPKQNAKNQLPSSKRIRPKGF